MDHSAEVLRKIRVAFNRQSLSQDSLQQYQISEGILFEDVLFLSHPHEDRIKLQTAKEVIALNLAMLLNTYFDHA